MALFLLENRDFLGFRNMYLIVHSILLKFEKIWSSGTLNIIRNPKKSLFSKRKRAITQERISITMYFTFTVPQLWPFFS
jgi:hypothetical protein